jgi:hypothetical protein
MWEYYEDSKRQTKSGNTLDFVKLAVSTQLYRNENYLLRKTNNSSMDAETYF